MRAITIISLFLLLYFGSIPLHAQYSPSTLVGSWTKGSSFTQNKDTLLLNLPHRVFTVTALGMGNAVVANGFTYNGMLDNPALLARHHRDISPLSLQASVGQRTTSTLAYLSDHKAELKDGRFLTELAEGLIDYHRYLGGSYVDERFAEVEKMNASLDFSQELIENVTGLYTNTQYGFGVVPKIQFQWDGWGFSVTSEFKSNFWVTAGHTLAKASEVDIVTDAQGYMLEDNYKQLLNIVMNTIDSDFSLKGDALPKILGVSTWDMVYTAGYAHSFNRVISAGVNINLSNRKYGVGLYEVGVYTEGGTASSFSDGLHGESSWSLNFDVGFLVQLEKSRVDIGGVVQNVIPYHNRTDVIAYSTSTSDITPMYATVTGDVLMGYYDYDAHKIIYDASDSRADTIVAVVDRSGEVTVPVQLAIPPYFMLGMTWRIVPHKLLFALDLNDLFFQVPYYNFADRISLGIEYWPWPIFAVRTGFTANHVTFGTSVSPRIRRVQTNLNYAMVYNSFADNMQFFFELGVTIPLGSRESITFREMP